MRAALVEYFRDEAAIMIATEAAAEGINLQFCNLVVNYDLPWNPQRIEQRIGRCHRYGQKFDVVVVNFLNKNNAADQRVYELLDEKFRLFNGVFGASDEVLGAVESGVDFEKRIAAIYQKCRTPEQIQFEFDQLQRELDTEIAAGQRDAREKLLDNFDQEVVEKVRIQSSGLLDRFNERLWLLTRYLLGRLRPIRRRRVQLLPHQQSFPRRDDPSRPVPARQERRRRQHLPRRPSAWPNGSWPRQWPWTPPPAEVVFDYSGSGKNIAALTRYVGQGGWLTCSRLEIQALEVEDALILSGFTDKQEPLDETACHRLFDLPGDCPDFRPTKMGLSPSVSGSPTVPTAMQGLLTAAAARRQAELLDTLMAKNSQWFDAEVNKLYRWSEDVKLSLETEIKDLDKEIRELRRASVLAQSLQDKLTFQKEIRELERRRTGKRRDLFNAQDAIDAKREDLIGKVEEKLKQTSSVQPLFTIRWRVQ